ncbi:MAG: hypothetical protein J6C19_00660 [Lachnospiraceae bacterium]|nr:hypothetical protein [Lachnospiraceae bacterium]
MTSAYKIWVYREQNTIAQVILHQGSLPSDAAEFVIDGGCHAYFGDYGAQKGDGEPAISPTEQIGQAAELTQGFIYD